jgi:hypothetical protein
VDSARCRRGLALVAWLLGKLVWLLVGETRSAVTTASTSVETRS